MGRRFILSFNLDQVDEVDWVEGVDEIDGVDGWTMWTGGFNHLIIQSFITAIPLFRYSFTPDISGNQPL